MGAVAILLAFDEAAAPPQDLAGGLDVLHGDPGAALAMPSVVESITGYGRLFATDSGLVASEATAGQTQLTRDLTVEVILAFDIASAGGGGNTLIARGVGGSAAERILFGFRLVGVTAISARLETFHQEQDGTDVADAAGPVIYIPESYLYLAVVREWVSATEVRIRYLAQGKVLAETTLTEGDIGEGDNGTTTVGCKGDGAGGYEEFCPGTVIDAIRVSDFARAAEEIEHEWRRMSIHQPQGVRTVQQLVPPGIPKPPLSTAPDSLVQRELAVEGGAIGHAVAKAEQLGDLMPDRAYNEARDRWEWILGLAPKPADLQATRRARILAHLAEIRGFANQDVPATLAELLDQDAEDVDIRRHTNLFADDFSGDLDTWTQHAGGGSIAVVSEAIRLGLVTATDGRWNNAQKNAVLLLRSVQTADGVGVDITAKISSLGLGTGVCGGVCMLNQITQELVVVGVCNVGGVERLISRRFAAGATIDTILENPWEENPFYVRLTYNGPDQEITLRYGATLDESWDAELEGTGGIARPDFVGCALVSDVAAPAGGSNLEIDDVRIWEPNGRRPFHWYVYRNLALSGEPDILGARQVVRRIAPAFSRAEVITELEFVFGASELGVVPYDIDGVGLLPAGPPEP